MRIIIAVICSLILSGCSQPRLYNDNTVELIEEALNLNVVSEEDAFNKSLSFIKGVKDRERKIKIEIIYKPAMTDLVNRLAVELSSIGLNNNNLKLELTDAAEDKDLVVKSIYKRYTNHDCGELSFHNRDEYRFGCALEFNRNISLVNSFK